MTMQTKVAGTGQFWYPSRVYAVGFLTTKQLASHHVTVGARVNILGLLAVSLSAYSDKPKY